MINRKKGFTLIELLVVIAIIGLLSTLAVVALGSAREKARDSKRLSDLKQVQVALELYYTDNNGYPEAEDQVLGLGNSSCLNSNGFKPVGCPTPYMGIVPVDPGSSSYNYTGAGESYSILANLEGQIGNLQAGDIEVTPSGIRNL